MKHMQSAWEEDLGVEVTNEMWREGVERLHLGSIKTRLQLIQFKVMHRLHYFTEQIYKMFPNVSDICDRKTF